MGETAKSQKEKCKKERERAPRAIRTLNVFRILPRQPSRLGLKLYRTRDNSFYLTILIESADNRPSLDDLVSGLEEFSKPFRVSPIGSVMISVHEENFMIKVTIEFCDQGIDSGTIDYLFVSFTYILGTEMCY